MSKILKIQTTANKGEWAEFYAHLKIICDQTIPRGNHNLEPDPNITYPVLAIFKQNFDYILNQQKDKILLKDKLTNTNQPIEILPIRTKLKGIFNDILTGEGAGAFGISEGLEISQYLSLPITSSPVYPSPRVTA